MAAVVLTVAAGGCGTDGDDGDGDGGASLPQVAEIDDAIAALDASLGGPQEYFEVNATPALVNLFVAAEDGTRVVPYVYLDGELRDPAPAGAVQGGATFAGVDVPSLDEVVFDRLLDELEAPILELFAVTAGTDGAVVLEVIVASERGGRLAVAVSPTGEILSVDTL